jgi:nitroreductase
MRRFNIYQIATLALVITLGVLALRMGNSSNPNNMDALSVIHARRSVRHFTAEQVKEDDLLALVKAGMAAPSAKNQQPWMFVIVTERGLLDTLSARLTYAKMLRQAQAAIVVCGDMSKAADPSMGLWTLDCSAATENILLAAQALGLGAVWTAAYPYVDRMAGAAQTLQLPDSITAFSVIPIGYPDGTDQPKDKWKPQNLRWNAWQQR